MYHHMIKAWLLDEMFQCDRTYLTIDGTLGEWGAGDSIAAEEELPLPPANVAAKSGNGWVSITCDPVP
jgi:tripartite motif-containing protein 71